MKAKLFLFFSAAFSLACSNDVVVPMPVLQDNVTYDTHPKNNEYQSELSNYRNTTNSPGAVLLVYLPSEPLWIGSLGKSNLAHNAPMYTNSQFRTGSVTKMLTATVILMLMEKNKLTLEDKLVEHLPQLAGKIPGADKISIRHLLGHLSGIFDPPNESLRYQADLINNPAAMYSMPMEDILEEYVFGKNLHFTPGAGYSYSNTNYWLLGMIAERISHRTIQELMEEMIFIPLQMSNTYIESRDDSKVARGYADLYNNGVLLDVSLWDRAEGDGGADGGLISTADDLFKFMTGLFNGKLISPTTLKEMKKIQWSSCNTPECEYGLGLEIWRTEAGIAYGHNGGLVGIEANVLYYENSGGISVLYKNNGNGSDKNWLGKLIK